MSDVTNSLPDQAEKGDEMAKKTAVAAKPEVKESEVKKTVAKAEKKSTAKPVKKTEAKKVETKKPAAKPEVKATVKTEAKKVEKKSAESKAKTETEKKTREKKIPLKVKAPKSVDVKETKYVVTATQGEKRMWMRGSSVGLTHKVTGFKAFKPVTEEDAKKNHLGKTRMLGKITTQDELNDLIAKYFGA